MDSTMDASIWLDQYYVDALYTDHRDTYNLVSAQSTGLSHSGSTQVLGHLEYDRIPHVDVTAEDLQSHTDFQNYEEQTELSNAGQGYNTTSAAFPNQQPTPFAYSSMEGLDSYAAIRDRIDRPIEPRSSSFSNIAEGLHERRPSRMRPRRQNRSCDQCRSAKRACDLPPSLIVQHQTTLPACSICKIRGLDCTVAWLTDKQSEQNATKRARKSSDQPRRNTPSESATLVGTSINGQWTTDVSVPDIPSSVITLDTGLAREFAATEACSLQFSLYVDIFDMPVSQCLQRGSMPPRYSLGVAAWASLTDSPHFSRYLEDANVWINTCCEGTSTSWASTKAGPHIFRAASVLDAIFQRRWRDHRGPMAQRDLSITETFKWVVVALTAQFTVRKFKPWDNSKSFPQRILPDGRDVAASAWHKAKEMVFGQIAAVHSFRLALSLLLFGLITPPGSSEQYNISVEDSRYALCKSIRRLRKLCAQARSCLSENENRLAPRYQRDVCNHEEEYAPVQMLPPEIKMIVLELVGAMEWMVISLNAVTIGTSRGKICAFPPEMDNLIQSSLKETKIHGADEDPLSAAALQEMEIDGSILIRARLQEQPFTTNWRHGISDDAVTQSIRQLAALAILLWKSVAGMTLVTETMQTGDVDYEEIYRRYTTAISLVTLWRSAFGTLDSTMKSTLEESRYAVWRMIAFCSDDADLAILLLYDLAQRIESHLAYQPPTPAKELLSCSLQSTSAYRKEQRLISAVQISIIAASCHGMSNPGFQGHSGLKAHIQDIGSHPVSVLKFPGFPSMPVLTFAA